MSTPFHARSISLRISHVYDVPALAAPGGHPAADPAGAGIRVRMDFRLLSGERPIPGIEVDLLQLGEGRIVVAMVLS